MHLIKVSIILTLSICISLVSITQSKRINILENCGISNNAHKNTRIVGGTSSSRGQFPWQVSLQRRSGGSWFHTCGATILNDYWMLTAAHCINGVDMTTLRAVVGADVLSESTDVQENHEISKIVKHESFSAQSMTNDIALIQVQSAINVNNSNGYINGICLPPEGQKFTQYVTLSGWGSTAIGGSVSSKLMFTNDVPIVSLPKCGSLYGYNAIKEGMLCAGSEEGGKGSCQGDSGGPLIQDDGTGTGRAVLVGISSWSRDCASAGIPSVFVEVSYFIDWINDNAV